jgi:hypothetical protein
MEQENEELKKSISTLEKIWKAQDIKLFKLKKIKMKFPKD